MGNTTRTAKKRTQATSQPGVPAQISAEIHENLSMGLFCLEKCELAKSKAAYESALRLAREHGDLIAELESLGGLFRLADESLDLDLVDRVEQELDTLVDTLTGRVPALPALVWYIKGGIARHRERIKVSQRYFHRALRALRSEPDHEHSGALLSADDLIARSWTMLAILVFQRGHMGRARHIAETLIARFSERNLKRVNGSLYLLLARIAERKRDLDLAEKLYHQAHASFMAEHNWYYHLHVLLGYARVARIRQKYSQAYLYLELLEKAASGAEFGVLKKEILLEKSRLGQDAVDLLVDSRKCVIRTREGGQISLGKQYVLLNILEALTNAHNAARSDQGLSKAEIVEKVWNERYRSEAHDNKLYYNINRLRKLIEPDVKQPRYLMNWKEGYRLAPGLRVQYLN